MRIETVRHRLDQARASWWDSFWTVEMKLESKRHTEPAPEWEICVWRSRNDDEPIRATGPTLEAAWAKFKELLPGTVSAIYLADESLGHLDQASELREMAAKAVRS